MIISALNIIIVLITLDNRPFLFYTNAYYGKGTGSIFLDNRQCTGTEDRLIIIIAIIVLLGQVVVITVMMSVCFTLLKFVIIALMFGLLVSITA